MASFYADLAVHFSIYAHISLVNILQVLLINHDLLFIGGNHNVLTCDWDNISAYKRNSKKTQSRYLDRGNINGVICTISKFEFPRRDGCFICIVKNTFEFGSQLDYYLA